ncbi:MAG: ribosomal protein S18-alanine N-acetyltransferase [Actinomycetota bacterium]
MSVIERFLRREHDEQPITLSPLRRRDLRRGVLAIEAASYPRPWSPGVFESEIDQVRSGSRFYLAARRGRDVVGYSGLWFTGEEAHVTNVAVHPDHRRAGVASTMLLALADEAIGRGCQAWTLEVRASSSGAQALYRRFGFAPAGVRTRYYENTEDAIVMWCNDIQEPEYRARLTQLAEEHR